MRVGLFPGQGLSPAAVLDALPAGHPLLERANGIVGYDLRKRVGQASSGSRRRLPTEIAQPAIFVAGVIAWEDGQAAGIECSHLAGHSLGEYAALVAGRALSFEKALSAVVVRADGMRKAAAAAPGGMAALIGVGIDEAQVIADKAGALVANDNAPRQVVIAGSDEALVSAASLARATGARCIRLELDAPFHTPAMAPAAANLEACLYTMSIRSPQIPVIANTTARPYRSPGEIRKLLVAQLTERVRFRESIEYLWSESVREHHDFGPGDVVGKLAAASFDHFLPKAVGV